MCAYNPGEEELELGDEDRCPHRIATAATLANFSWVIGIFGDAGGCQAVTGTGVMTVQSPSSTLTPQGCARRPRRAWSGAPPRTRHAAGGPRHHVVWPRPA